MCDFIESYCTITKDTVAGKTGQPIELLDFQRRILDGLFVRRPDGRMRHRTGLIGVPRKNGKSALGSGIALYGLFLGPDGAEVYSCAGEKDQARIVFGVAKRMIEAQPELAAQAKLYRDVIEVPSTGSIYRVLSSEAYSKEGLSPTLVVFDEVHVQPDEELWDVMTLGSGARLEPLVLGITTAGSRTDSLGRDTLCYRLYQHGCKVASGEVDDPSFFFAWWEPKAGVECDHRDPKVWAESNPGYGVLVDPEDFAAVVTRTRESEFRTKRTNVWVTSSEGALPHGVWDSLKADRPLVPHEKVVLFTDGSWAGDSTAVVGCTLADRHLWVVGAWERPPDAIDWRVPMVDVKAAIHKACRDFTVIEAVFDPYRWQAQMQELEGEGVPVVEYPTNSLARMVPAWKQFYDGVMDQTFSHDGDPRLARHVENMRLKVDAHGARPVKETRSSTRHIDLGICAIGALDRAMAPQEQPTRVFVAFS